MTSPLSWPPAPGFEALRDDEAQVWSIRHPLSGGAAERCDAVLTDDERSRAASSGPEERSRFVMARGTLRILLARHLGMLPEEVRFTYGEHGKPTLTGDAPGRLRFSVSHTGDLALLAFTTEREVGVDVERVREVPRMERIAGRVLAPDRFAEWRALEPGVRLQAFFEEWTALEALAKLRGDGVWRTVIQRGHRDPAAVSRVRLAPLAGYVGALAVEGAGSVRVRCWSAGAADYQL